MKYILSTLLLVLFLTACNTEKQNEITEVEIIEDNSNVTAFTDSEEENAVIYEANIRQYSPEGTFNAFTKDMPVLKELGVKIIWLMPINKISEVKRKATDGRFTSEIEDEEERSKYLGSYYSVSDYRSINPEFGTMEDFKNLVETAHDHGIYVIIDWVPNHTGWDHPWITEHPDYYTQNEKGEIIDPINPDTGQSWGWTDTADLNYDNLEMRDPMLEDLKYWINETNIDGFRMDVAHKVPVDFFESVTEQLEEIKPDIFMLAEAEQPDLMVNAFDMQYSWEGHHIINEIAKGHMTVKDFDRYMEKLDKVLEEDDIQMNFVTNHDENSWNGTIEERMPNKKEIFTALIYTMPGMPLIYSGQEYDLNKRLKFFEKDSIPKTKGDYFDLLVQLGELKNNNPALHGGKNAADYERLKTNHDEVLFFKRSKAGNNVWFIGNFSDEPKTVNFDFNGNYTDYINDENVDLSNNTLELKPWDYKIYIN